MLHLETFSSAVISAIAQSALKGSLIVLLAAAITTLLRRRTAALRHLVWTIALASVVLITLAGPVLPQWHVVPLPKLLADFADQVAVSPSAIAVQPTPTFTEPTAPVIHDATSTQRIAAAKSTPSTAISTKTAPAQPQSYSGTTTSAPVVTSTSQHHIASTSWLGLIWLLGASLLLVRYLLSTVRLRAMLLRSRRVLAPEWIALEQQVSSALRIHRPITLLASDGVDVPITCGVIYPRVVLPASADDWTLTRRHAVLSHELAHVRRFDAATQWIAFAAAIVCWFNPLVWYAVRQMRFERERACDDVVLASGARPSDYASDLLAIVSSFGNSDEKYRVALAMARRSQFEGRLLALLDPAIEHKFLSRGALAIVTVCALALVIPVAAARLAQAPPTPPAAPAPPSAQTEAPSAPEAPEPAIAGDNTSDEPAPVATSATAAAPAGTPHAAPHPAPMPIPAAQRTSGIAPEPPPPASPAATPAPGAPPSHMFGSSGMFAACNNASQRNISRHEDDGHKRWEVTVRGNDCHIDMRAEGDVRFKSDFSGVDSIPSGGYLTVKTVVRGETNDLDVRPNSGGLQYTYSRNGSRIPMDAAAVKWLGEFLVELDRSSAFAVDTRLPQLLAQGGPARVLQETALMSDYARATYIAALMKKTQLSPADAREVVRQAGITQSDYYSTQILMAVADKFSLDDPNLSAGFVAAIDHLGSDYYHTEVIKRLLDASPKLTPQQSDILLRSVARMQSDYYITESLKRLVEKRLVPAEGWATYIETTGKISSGYYRSEALRSMMQSYSGDPGVIERSILAAEKIPDDYYKLEVLRTARDRFKIEGPVRDAYVRVARTIQSETYRNQALAGLVSSGVL